MGRLPSSAIVSPFTGGSAIGGTNTPVGGAGAGNPAFQQANQALQPACLILLTDGHCLRCPPSEGGGTLQLQLGGQPLREFYKEREYVFGSLLSRKYCFWFVKQNVFNDYCSVQKLFDGINVSFV